MDAIGPLSRSPASAPRIDAERIRLAPAPVVVGGGGEDAPITVVPLLDGETVRFLEIRCPCGRSLTVECVYESAAGARTPEAPTPNEAAPQEESSR